jgi:nitrate reductase gamma subunit
VESWIDFGRGPLFRLAFSIMLLGLLRAVVLTLTGLEQAYRKNMDRIVPWREVFRQTAAWMFPVSRFWRRRPFYGTVSFLFHVGLLVVPFFFASHVLLWRRSAGFSWPGIAAGSANWLTLMVIVAGAGLLGGRIFHPGARSISHFQDYAWLLLLLVPFVTGYVCVNLRVGPGAYQSMMLLHVYSADFIMLMIPFTKMAHCVLAPLSQAVTAVAWKFPPGAGDRVATTLGYGQRPSWVEKSRLEVTATAGSKDEVRTR